VIAGEAGGRRLAVPAGDGVRPTTDRVKESVFSALGDHRLRGARVLDLFAGSGALGIEALSRGGVTAVFVDRDRTAVSTVEANLATVGFADRARVVRAEARAFLTAPGAGAPFDLLLLDPPYDLADAELAPVLAALADPLWTASGAVVVLERAGDAGPPPWPPGWASTWERCYGDTLVLFGNSSEEGTTAWPPPSYPGHSTR
jgi:16S rRNA (guanine966-N2)-methyltransferase